MLNPTRTNRIKNENLARLRMELSCYLFDVKCRTGNVNVVMNIHSRVSSSVDCKEELMNLPRELCHTGFIRIAHMTKIKNLPYSVEDVKKITKSRKGCSEKQT